jgi:broad specificity phosphatase PhoE
LLHLVRHAAVTVRPEIDGPLWHLSPEGRAGADALAGEPFWQDVERLLASSEPKAYGTGQRIAAKHGLPLRIEHDLREVSDRAWVAGGYEELVRRYFAGENVGWEPRDAALARVRACIEAIASTADGDVAVVAHGLVLTLYLSDLLGLDSPAAFELWSRIRFPDVCTLEGTTVVRPFGA